MLLLTSTSDKIQVVTGSAVNIDVHASWVDLASGTVTPDRKNTKISTAATTDVVPAPAASTMRNVKALFVANIHATNPCVVTIQHTDGTNVIQIESVTLLAGERISIKEGVPTRVIDANGMEKTNANASVFTKTLTADVANTTVTAAKITGLDYPTAVGTWLFEYWVYYTTVITTTGIKLGVNHTGTVAPFMYNVYGVDTAATAATAAMDQDALAATGQVFAAWAARAKTTTAPIISGGVDTNAADMLMRIEGMFICTVTGNLELYSASEVAASSTSVKAGTSLRLTKVG